MAIIDQSLVLTIVLAVFHQAMTSEEYKLGALIPYTYDQHWDYPFADHYASAISLAIDDVNNDQKLLKGAKLSFVWNDTACNRSKMAEQLHWQIGQGVVGFVGPSCFARKAATVAKKHELAVISFDSSDSHLSNRTRFPNFARTNPQYSKAASRILSLVKSRGLKKVSIVFEERTKWRAFKRLLKRLFARNNIEIVATHKIGIMQFYLGFPEFLYTLPTESEATIIAATFDLTREIVYKLQAYYERNPSSSYSRHQFISAVLDQVSVRACMLRPFKWFFSAYSVTTPASMNITKRGFGKVSLIVEDPVKETEKFKAFSKNVKEVASNEPWFSNAYQGCLLRRGKCLLHNSDVKISLKAVYLYDAVMQFAHALHEVRVAGQKPTGQNIVDKLKGRNFVGADGYRHKFDENAEVIYNYAVLQLRRNKNNQLSMLPIRKRKSME